MIPYKYVSFEAAIKIIQNATIGFPSSRHMNDPLEGQPARYAGASVDGYIIRDHHRLFRNEYERSCGVLSLTRQPLNPLMWAHYGDEHKGVVIGIDVERAGFLNLETCLLPANYGEVIYTATFPNSILPEDAHHPNIRLQHGFDPASFTQLKAAFLYKAMDWCYEEEVRVVKNIDSVQTDQSPRHRREVCE